MQGEALIDGASACTKFIISCAVIRNVSTTFATASKVQTIQRLPWPPQQYHLASSLISVITHCTVTSTTGNQESLPEFASRCVGVAWHQIGVDAKQASDRSRRQTRRRFGTASPTSQHSAWNAIQGIWRGIAPNIWGAVLLMLDVRC